MMRLIALASNGTHLMQCISPNSAKEYILFLGGTREGVFGDKQAAVVAFNELAGTRPPVAAPRLNGTDTNSQVPVKTKRPNVGFARSMIFAVAGFRWRPARLELAGPGEQIS